ncbi:MAG: GyrI-like domain-containing protein [Bacteroidales bacterium]|nr:GyrI-like domain-containing protein [Bacteroidales bacterium]
MDVRIESCKEIKLVGFHLQMSFMQDRTFELWRSFMPKRNEILNRVGSDLISMQVFPNLPDFRNFNPGQEFDKWAAVEVSDFSNLPENMEAYTIKGGLYAIFTYKGSSAEVEKPFRYIFGTWLSASEYELDHREHLAVMGAKYKNNDPDSEEDLWIPVKLKSR